MGTTKKLVEEGILLIFIIDSLEWLVICSHGAFISWTGFVDLMAFTLLLFACSHSRTVVAHVLFHPFPSSCRAFVPDHTRIHPH